MDTVSAKYANTQNAVIEVIRKRFSPRSFADQTLEVREIETLLEAAGWAPSAMNEQPWRFAVARREDTAEFEILASLLFEGNHVWASKSAALIVVLAASNYARNGRENINAAHDTGMATQNLLLQAAAMDIYGHVMEGFDKIRAREVLQLQENIIPVSMIALGRLGEPDRLEEPYLSRELAARNRRPVPESLIPVPTM